MRFLKSHQNNEAFTCFVGHYDHSGGGDHVNGTQFNWPISTSIYVFFLGYKQGMKPPHKKKPPNKSMQDDNSSSSSGSEESGELQTSKE